VMSGNAMISIGRILRGAAAAALVGVALGSIAAQAQEEFPVRLRDDAGRRAHAGLQADPSIEIGDNGEVILELWWQWRQGQFSSPATPSSSFPARWRTAAARRTGPRPTRICSHRRRCRDLAAAGRSGHLHRKQVAAFPDQHQLRRGTSCRLTHIERAAMRHPLPSLPRKGGREPFRQCCLTWRCSVTEIEKQHGYGRPSREVSTLVGLPPPLRGRVGEGWPRTR